MKNISIFFRVVALVSALALSVTACSKKNTDGNTVSSTSGELTITGIPSAYNGKYVAANADYPDLTAASSFEISDFRMVYTGGQISDGSVTLTVWELEDNGTDFSDTFVIYEGNDHDVTFSVSIYEEMVFHDLWDEPIALGEATVNFANGNGSGSYVPGQ